MRFERISKRRLLKMGMLCVPVLDSPLVAAAGRMGRTVWTKLAALTN
jgi:hypothetical protein